jgi:hypothetical protein
MVGGSFGCPQELSVHLILLMMKARAGETDYVFIHTCA